MIASNRAFFQTGQTRSYEFRRQQLQRLDEALKKYAAPLAQALKTDLGKGDAECLTTEMGNVAHEIHTALRNLRRWMKPRRTATPLHLWPAQSRVHYEPLGVTLILGTWNYPVQLTLAPLIGSIAAGNCAVVKPSEVAPATSRVLAQMLSETFAPEYINVVEGGPDVAQALLREKFDHIFFTGSTSIGQKVYEAAARTLTPVTLELGGKSPAVVTADADLALAARRLVWGKFMNAGQTCVAPDYVYADARIASRLIDEIRSALTAQYGTDPRISRDYGRIVSPRHFERLQRMCAGSTAVMGGGASADPSSRYFAPTVLAPVGWDAPVMQEEIFGPLLPVLTYSSLDEALSEIRKRDKPLAAYLFASDAGTQERFKNEISSGGMTINDTVIHLGNARLPFGGVGPSGIGAYHGQHSFEVFSHKKSVVTKSGFMDLAIRYPPFSAGKLKWLRRVLQFSQWFGG